MRISDWSSDVCSSDLRDAAHRAKTTPKVSVPVLDSVNSSRTAAVVSAASSVRNRWRKSMTARSARCARSAPMIDSNEPSAAVIANRVGNRLSSPQKATSRSEEHTSELQSLMRISYAVFCLKKKKKKRLQEHNYEHKQKT